MTWVFAAIAAAFAQNIRSIFQKQLSLELSNVASAFGRFLFAWPFALAAFGLWLVFSGHDLPIVTPAYWGWVLCGALMQSGFTIALSQAFRLRNFAVAVTFTKTAVVQTAIFEALLLRSFLSPLQWFAIALSFSGVIALSITRAKMTIGDLVRSLASPACLWGLSGGALLGVSGVFYRAATQSLTGSTLSIALTVLVTGLTIQVLLFTVYLLVRTPDQLWGLIKCGKRGWGIGLSGMLGSTCWFVGYTLAPAALVNAVGQVELLFALFTGWFFFKERSSAGEIAGLCLIGCGVLIILLS